MKTAVISGTTSSTVKPDKRIKDLTGNVYGYLTVIGPIKRHNAKVVRLCHCKCGNDTWVESVKLRRKHTQSCGCYRSDFKKLKSGEAVRNNILDDYKRGASKRNFSWTISDDTFDRLLGGQCVYCCSPPSRVRKGRRGNGDFVYNGIDRVNSSLGYDDDNVVSCCYVCNRAKSDMTLQEFNSWIERLVKHYGTR